MSAMLANVYIRAIEAALHKEPCGRCTKDHELALCPIGNDYKKGEVWKMIGPGALKAADVFLQKHPDYAYVAPIKETTSAKPTAKTSNQQQGDRRGPRSSVNTSANPPGGRSIPPVNPPVHTRSLNYSNTNRGSDMYYPTDQGLSRDQETPSDTGKAWKLPQGMLNRPVTLKIPEPQFALRQDFFRTSENKRILTNHFEYKVSIGTIFYEYKLLDFGTKNRKKLRALFHNAIENWSFLKQNENSLATNYIDTIISWKSLHEGLGEGESVEGDSLEWGGSIVDGNNNLALRFRFVKEIPIHKLERYAAADPNYEIANFDDIAKCLNLAISKSFNTEVQKLSSNKFFVKKARVPLRNQKKEVSDSLEIIRGYFYNVKPGMGNIILNFNISTSAVFRPITVADFLNGNNTFAKDKVAHILKGKNVYIDLQRQDPDQEKQKHLNSEDTRYWKICEIQQDGVIDKLKFRKKVVKNGNFVKKADGSFEMEKQETMVVDHLTQVFRRSPEHLRIVPYQPYTRPVPDDYTTSMVKEACRNPETSRAYIENEGLRTLGFITGSGTVAFNGTPISLDPTMLQVPRMVINFPRPVYKNKGDSRVSVKAGSRWNWPNEADRFFTTKPTTVNYVIIATPKCDSYSPDFYDGELRNHVSKCGLSLTQFRRVPTTTISPFLSPKNESTLEDKLQKASESNVSLVVLVMNKYDLTTYRDFKDMADRSFGMQSICLVENFKDDKKFRSDLTTNVMMKLNLKLGGVNHVISAVEQSLKDTMVLGGDLVHPGSGAFPGTPSIACIVGSVDNHGGKCLGSMRLQNVHKKDREIMDPETVEAMVIERLRAWADAHHKGNSRLPANIIYYRDGVSAGHYPKVQDLELKAIRDAYATMRIEEGLKPQALNLTAVIVTKRHHTRFHPINAEDTDDRYGNKNCIPGTCVDKLVTSPYYQDFYLQSHSGIKGTARPTHYFALENNVPLLTLEKLRDLTHDLSYSYVRSMTSVSYVSPTYYADRLCERGRLYIRKYYNGDDDALWKEYNAFKSNLEDELKAAREKKFGAYPRVNAKTKEEKAVEKTHAERVAKEAKDFVFKKIASEFYPHWDERDPENTCGNPWADSIAQTMFWM